MSARYIVQCISRAFVFYTNYTVITFFEFYTNFQFFVDKTSTACGTDRYLVLLKGFDKFSRCIYGVFDIGDDHERTSCQL
jgi:hypothetical protein